MVSLSCPEPNPKQYDVYFRENLATGSWTLLESITTHEPFNFSELPSGNQGFYQVNVLDAAVH